MMRLTRLVIDPKQLEPFKAALKEEIELSLALEPGVHKLIAIAERAEPSHILIVGVFADAAAYQAHMQAPHYLKYRRTTKAMVKELEQIGVEALTPGDDVAAPQDETGVGWGFG